MSIVTVYIPSPYNVFLYFLKGQVHKENKLGIMTNVGRNCSTPQHCNNCSAPIFLILFKKNLDPLPFKKEGRDYAFYKRDYKRETIKLLPFYMTDFLFTEL